MNKEHEQKMKEELSRSRLDSQWFWENYDTLKEKYPYELVAIFNRTIVAHSKDMKRLKLQLREQFGNKRTHITVEYLTLEKVEMIL